MTIFLDTNVLLYSIGTADDEIAKRRTALELLERADCVLSVQVLQEFYSQATRTARTDALAHGSAVLLIEGWLRFPVQENTVALLQKALDLRKRTGFSYWNCAILAAAAAAGCNELYTEDLTHGRDIAGVLIVNPFRDA